MNPAQIADYLLAFHWMAGYRRAVGILLLGVSALVTGLPNLNVPVLTDHASVLALAGTYLAAVGWILRGHQLPGAGK